MEFEIRVVLVGTAETWRVAELLDRHQIGARSDSATILTWAGTRAAVFDEGIPMNHHAGRALWEGTGVAVAHGMNPAQAPAEISVHPGQPSSAPVHLVLSVRPASLRAGRTERRDRRHPQCRP